MEKIQKRMTTWKGKLLNKVGKIWLAKSVTSSIPIYSMQIHLLPKAVCTRIDSLTRSSIWAKDGSSRGWSLVNWKMMILPKKFGGMGIRDTRLTNLALVGKLIRSILHEQDKLWVQVLTHRYLRQDSLWTGKKKARDSSIWYIILQVISVFKDGLMMKFGAGNSSFWFSDWTGQGSLCNQVDYVHSSDTATIIRDIWHAASWNL